MPLNLEQRDEVERIVEENAERIRELFGPRIEGLEERFRDREEGTSVYFESLRDNYQVYNATDIPVRPKGVQVLIDLRGASTSGTVAKYVSFGDKWAEEWVKTI